MKRSALVFSLITALFVSAVTSTSYADVIQKDSIDSFRVYSWGTDSQTIIDQYVESLGEGVNNDPDFKIEDAYEMKDYALRPAWNELQLNDFLPVGGINATVHYYFYNDELIAGCYSFVYNTETSDFSPKYTKVYGEPAVIKEDDQYGQCFVWIDNSKNVIVLTDSSAYYISCAIQDAYPYSVYGNYAYTIASDIIGFDYVKDWYGLDLQKEIDKFENYDGI